MLTVLRIEGDRDRLREYVSGINGTSIVARAHIDRAGRVVADLSKEKADWNAHTQEVATSLRSLRDVLLAAQRAGDPVIVDTGIYARSEFAPGTAVSMDSYRYPPQLLGLMAELSATLEITVTSMSPD